MNNETTQTRMCQLCGKYKATRLARDDLQNECWSCGYCHRWHPAMIPEFLRIKRIFANWEATKSLDAWYEGLLRQYEESDGKCTCGRAMLFHDLFEFGRCWECLGEEGEAR